MPDRYFFIFNSVKITQIFLLLSIKLHNKRGERKIFILL